MSIVPFFLFPLTLSIVTLLVYSVWYSPRKTNSITHLTTCEFKGECSILNKLPTTFTCIFTVHLHVDISPGIFICALQKKDMKCV